MLCKTTDSVGIIHGSPEEPASGVWQHWLLQKQVEEAGEMEIEDERLVKGKSEIKLGAFPSEKISFLQKLSD